MLCFSVICLLRGSQRYDCYVKQALRVDKAEVFGQNSISVIDGEISRASPINPPRGLFWLSLNISCEMIVLNRP